MLTESQENALLLIAEAAVELGWSLVLHANDEDDMCLAITVGELDYIKSLGTPLTQYDDTH